MNDFLSIFLKDTGPRMIGVVVAFVVTFAASKGIDLDGKEVTALFTATYAIVHRLITTPKAVKEERAARAVRRSMGLASEADLARRRDT